MELSYTSSRRDVMSFYWRSLRRSPRHRRSWLATVLLATGAGGVVAWSTGASPVPAMAALAVATAVLLALAPLALFKPHVRMLVLEPEGIRTTINGKAKSYAWTDIASVEEVGNRIIIQCANLNAFVVPPEAFPSTVDRRAACGIIRGYFKSGSMPKQS